MKLAFDIGGTTIEYVVYDDSKVYKKDMFDVNGMDKDQVVKKLADIANENTDVTKIGISAPGAFDLKTGFCTGTTGIKHFGYFNLYDEMKVHLKNKDVKIVAFNDAKSALLGVISTFNESERPSSAIMIAFGTGIGGAFYINNEIWQGHDNFAGELGFPVWDNGLWISEAISTVNFLMREFGHKDGRKVMNDYHTDATTKAKVDDWMKNIAKFLDTLTYWINPEVILLTGGITKNELWQDLVEKAYRQYIDDSGHKVVKLSTKILPVKIQDNFGLLGAKELIRKYL